MLEVFLSDRGRALLTAVSEVVQTHFQADLDAGSLGGGAASIDVTLLGPTGHFPLTTMTIASSTWRKPHKLTGLHTDALRQQQRSVRVGMSCSDADLLGDTPLPDETGMCGNVVVAVPPGETYMLIVSAGGLDLRRREAVCQFVADLLVERLPHVLRDLDIVQHEDTYADAA